MNVLSLSLCAKHQAKRAFRQRSKRLTNHKIDFRHDTLYLSFMNLCRQNHKQKLKKGLKKKTGNSLPAFPSFIFPVLFQTLFVL